MKDAIDDFFSGLPECPSTWGGSFNGNRSEEDKVFEIYIYTLIARQFKINGNWNLDCFNCNSYFKFRGSPGVLWSNKDFGYITLENKVSGKQFELHLGIEIKGNSGVNHEIDVGIFERDHAQHVRVKKSNPHNIRGEYVPLAIECKYYISAKVNKSLGRYCVGQALDTARSICNTNRINYGMLVTSSYEPKENINMLLKHYDIVYIDQLDSVYSNKVNDFNDFVKTFIPLLK